MSKPKFYRYGKHKSLSEIHMEQSKEIYLTDTSYGFEYYGHLVDAFRCRNIHAIYEKYKYGDRFSMMIINSMYLKAMESANAD